MNLISVIAAAAELGKRRQTIHKIVNRLKIEKKLRRDPSKGNQKVTYITQADFARVRSELDRKASRSEDAGSENGDLNSPDEGVFYLAQLEPDFDPGRFKVGHADYMPERLATHRCSAPSTTVLKTWPCKKKWEKTAMDAVTVGCEQLHTEVFRTDSLEEVAARCDKFFAMMPELDNGEVS